MANFLIRLIVHLLIFLIQGYSMYYNLTYVELVSNKTYGGRFKFLTFLNSCLQVFYFGFCVVYDVVQTKEVGPEGLTSERPPLQKFRDIFYSSVMFPLGTFVVLTFWGIYAVNRELVFPKFLDQVIPPWLNHNMHTTVLLFLLVDMWLVYHHYSSRKLGLTCTVVVAMLYQVWILWIKYHADFWVYPVLDALDFQGRVLFFGGLWISLIAIYLTGEALNKQFWGVSRSFQCVKDVKTK